MEDMVLDADIWRPVGAKKVIQVNTARSGEIYRGQWSVVFDGMFDECRVAVKRVDRAKTGYECEVNNLRQFDHQNIVRYLYKDEDIEYIYIAMQKCTCSLQNWLDRIPHRPNLHEVSTMKQITKGLRYLHSKGFIHRNLHPSNILLLCDVDRVIAKISDFEVTKKTTSGLSTSNSGSRGSDCYEAPEMINKHEKISEKTDIFSLGLIFCNISAPAAQHPYGNDEINIKINIRDGETPNLDSVVQEACNGYILPLVKSMLVAKKEERADTSEILAHYTFWDERKTIHFFQNASDYIYGKTKDATETQRRNVIRRNLSKGWRQVLGENGWLEKAFGSLQQEQQEVVQEQFIVNGKLKLPADTATESLLRLIRNWAHHYDEYSDEFRAIVGKTKLDMLNFFTKRFLCLLPHTYEAFKECRIREDFIHFYQMARQSDICKACQSLKI